MKTKKLIQLLQKADPSGEEECNVNNIDISDIVKLPANFDGCFQIIIRDEKNRIVSTKYMAGGHKIVLYTTSISDVLLDYPDMPVDLSNLSENGQKRYQETIDKTRKANKDLMNNLDKGYFFDHIKQRVLEFTGETEGLKELCNEFFDNNLHRDNPLPKDLSGYGIAYIEARNKQWERELDVSYDGNEIIIKKKV